MKWLWLAKPDSKRHRRQVFAVEHGIERRREPFAQHIVVDRDAGPLAEAAAQMIGRLTRDIGEPVDAPAACGGGRHGFRHAGDRTCPSHRARLTLEGVPRPRRGQRHRQKIEPARFHFEGIAIAFLEACAQQAAQQQGFRIQQAVRSERAVSASVGMFRRERIVETKDDGAVAFRAGVTQPVGRIGGKEHRMARRADGFPVGRVVLGKQTAQGQHHEVAVLLFDLALSVRDVARLEEADLQSVAFKQDAARDVQGSLFPALFPLAPNLRRLLRRRKANELIWLLAAASCCHA